jgi:fructokinase
MSLDVVSLGELLVEFVRRERDVMHTVPGDYVGPFPSGAPAITIDSCARLGLRSGFIGVVGADDFGEMLVLKLKSDGVDTSRIRVDEGSATAMAFVAYRSDGSRRFVFTLKSSASARLSLVDVDPEYVAKARVLHISGSTMYISKSSREACMRAVEVVKGSNTIITLDPNIRLELESLERIREVMREVIRHVNILLVGEDELLMITGVNDISLAIRRTFEWGLDMEMVVVKKGKRGSLAVTSHGEAVEVPAFPVREVDPTGAGDVFNAAFIYGVLKNWKLDKILLFANAAGAIKVGKVGPMEGPKSYNEVVEFIKEKGYTF